MVGIIVFAAVCGIGIMFLVYVLIALCREAPPRLPRRKFNKRSAPIVVQLPPEPIFTANAIRPAEVPEDTPFAIVSRAGRTAAAFYVDACESEPERESQWRLFVNPHRAQVKKAR